MATRAISKAMRDANSFAELAGHEMPTEEPKFRPSAIDSAIERAGAIYALRIIQGSKLHARMIHRGCISDHDLLGMLGLEVLPSANDKLTPRQLREVLIQQEARLIHRGMPRLGRLETNIALIAEVLKLSKTDVQVLRFAVVVSQVNAFQDLFNLRTFGLQHFIGMVGHAVGVKTEALHPSLSAESALRQAGILQTNLTFSHGRHPLQMDEDFAMLLLAPRFDEKMLLRHILRPAPASTLSMQDFPDRMDISMLRRYLRVTVRDRRKGVNILIHGATGTGKTEFVRALSVDLGLELSEVPTEDSSGDPVSGERRFSAFTLAQNLLAMRRKQILLFDEVEDVFGTPDNSPFGASFSFGYRPLAKGWVNQTLESNPIPTIWVCNSISGIDAAYLRRFDLALEFRSPTGAYRRRVVDRHLDQSLVSEECRSKLVSMEELPPASLERIARVVRALKSSQQTDRDREAEESARLVLQAMGRRLEIIKSALPSHYDPAFLNTNPDVSALSKGLVGRQSARLCLYGPPGTGKTAFAHHLAQLLDVPLHVKRASDLQSMWLGQAEKNIARAFQAARDERAILLIDEADSFLQDRSNAHRSWEVSQVNEMLTQMEAFEGIFIASTNLMDSLDAASLRRFDFKVNFGYLTRQQRKAMFERVMVEESVEGTDATWLGRLDRMDRLVPGDFANVLRQLKVMGHQATPARLVQLLEAELRFKPGANERRIGF